jgi:hypothetical protein
MFLLEATKRKATSQVVEGLPEGEQRALPPPTQIATVLADEDNPIDASETQGKFLLHVDDPNNFLKLCAAIRILLRHQLTDANIDRAERLIREYCTELISVRPHII